MINLRFGRELLLLTLAVLLGCVGCTAYSPQGVRLGSTQADARQQMGVPTAMYAAGSAESPAHSRLEYARGPMGKHTYMLDFDAQDRLMSWQQVLTEANFFTVVPGWRDSQVRALLGTPSSMRQVGWRGEIVWSYRYEAPFCVWFEISLIEATVVSVGNSPDPICEDKGDRKID